jgi:hypothetical protein
VEMEYTEWDVAYIRGIRYKDLGLMLKTWGLFFLFCDLLNDVR